MKRSFILIMFSTVMVGCGSKVDEAYELKKLDLKDKAIEFLTKIISEDPKNADAYFALGNIYAESGKIREATEQYTNALKLKPNNNRFQGHMLLLQMLQQPAYSTELDEKVLAMIKRDEDDKLGYVLLANLYSREANTDKTIAKKYFDVIAKLNDLATLSDWQTVYVDPAIKNITANSFIVVSDSTEYYDESHKFVGFLKKGGDFKVNKIEKDTIGYTDPNAFGIGYKTAWRLDNVYGWRQRNYEIKNPDALYTEPLCAHINEDTDREIMYGARQYISRARSEGRGWRYVYISEADLRYAPQVPKSVIEQGPLTSTGRYKQHVIYYFFAESNYQKFTSFSFDWSEVKYKTRVNLRRKLPVSTNILLFKDDRTFALYSSLEGAKIKQNLLDNVFRAGYVAKNMTPDLVNLSIDLQFEKFEFDKNIFKLHYKSGLSTLVFTDGLLESITTSPKVEDLSQYEGIHSSVSETGDSCEELAIKIIGGEVTARYRSWYCGEGGQPPEFEALSNVSIKDGKFKGTSASGSEIVWNLKKEQSQ